MANRLGDSTSPYLLQHKDNPVDWYEWGPDAFAAAKLTDRPILLSVGYSACHWCHVMAHESFEDPETADVMNDLFVNIKVDREERPDVDAIYMDAVQTLSGQGGWPMTVFLTPDGRPFYAGTYFPKVERHGMPSFRRVLTAISDAWSNRRDDVEEQAAGLTATVSRHVKPASDLPGEDSLERAYRSLHAGFDPTHGGFGGAPKFPQAPVLEFLLRVSDETWAPEAADMLATTLARMAAGGIYDHIGGGFARYSVDQRWLIPHFEKMLYDNAQLARLYLRAWQQLGDERLRVVAVETLDYLLRDLRHADGGFFSAEDADSEGEEGKFYVWSLPEFRQVVGTDGAHLLERFFGVTASGNFEGANHLYQAQGLEDVAAEAGVSVTDAEATLARARARLYEERSRRIRPGLDDKVIASWNGLALRALAEAGAVLSDDRYLASARANARFVVDRLKGPDGRLMRSWREGRTSVPGFADDYASYALGLFALYQATAEPEWFREARKLTDDLVELFRDPDGGFFTTGEDAEALVARPKEQMDNPLPAGNSLAAEALLVDSLFTGNSLHRQLAEDAVRSGGQIIDTYPAAAGHLLSVVHMLQAPPKEVAVTGPEADDLAAVVWESFRPHLVLAVDRDGTAASDVPLLRGRYDSGRTQAFVCENFTCRMPVETPEDLRAQLGA
ncbi:MAG: thioredoxin domain-containing protein [Acidimicrobiia bacterium]